MDLLSILATAATSALGLKVLERVGPKVLEVALRPLGTSVAAAFAPRTEKRKAEADAGLSEEAREEREIQNDEQRWEYYRAEIAGLKADMKATRGEMVALAKFTRSVMRSIHKERPPIAQRIMGRVDEPVPDIIFQTQR